jgi:hypothetical protein
VTLAVLDAVFALASYAEGVAFGIAADSGGYGSSHLYRVHFKCSIGSVDHDFQPS